jgi:hypothetical protein
MGELPYIPITDQAQYADIADRCADTTCDFMDGLHALEAAISGSTDAGPMIQGVFLGLITYAMTMSDMTVERLRADLLVMFDQLAPQIAMQMAAEAAGGHMAGEA